MERKNLHKSPEYIEMVAKISEHIEYINREGYKYNLSFSKEDYCPVQ